MIKNYVQGTVKWVNLTLTTNLDFQINSYNSYYRTDEILRQSALDSFNYLLQGAFCLRISSALGI